MDFGICRHPGTNSHGYWRETVYLHPWGEGEKWLQITQPENKKNGKEKDKSNLVIHLFVQVFIQFVLFDRHCAIENTDERDGQSLCLHVACTWINLWKRWILNGKINCVETMGVLGLVKSIQFCFFLSIPGVPLLKNEPDSTLDRNFLIQYMEILKYKV